MLLLKSMANLSPGDCWPGCTIGVTFGEQLLPFPDGCDASLLHEKMTPVYETPLEDAVAETIERFRQLQGG